jgi:hypothetical protein
MNLTQVLQTKAQIESLNSRPMRTYEDGVRLEILRSFTI